VCVCVCVLRVRAYVYICELPCKLCDSRLFNYDI